MLSVTTQYALRSLIELSRQPAGGVLLGRDLAERAGIAKDYLAKILGTLRAAGLVASAPGIGGGYCLARAPETIRLIDIVRLFEGEAGLPQCLLNRTRPCSDGDPCSAHVLWSGVREDYLAFLERTTIAAASRAAGTQPTRSEARRTARPDRTAKRKNRR
jgi:Rrf2 family protein